MEHLNHVMCISGFSQCFAVVLITNKQRDCGQNLQMFGRVGLGRYYQEYNVGMEVVRAPEVNTFAMMLDAKRADDRIYFRASAVGQGDPVAEPGRRELFPLPRRLK